MEVVVVEDLKANHLWSGEEERGDEGCQPATCEDLEKGHLR